MTVYILTHEGQSHVDPMPIKIGYSKNVRRRMSQLQTGSPYKLSLMGKIRTQGRSADQILERALHERYASRRLDVGEWFHLEPSDVIDMLKLHSADGYITVGTEPFEIVSYDRDAVPEYASPWLWGDVEAYEFCPVCGWAGGWSYNDNYGGERCLKCGASEGAYDRAY
jgi:hypothetical protein